MRALVECQPEWRANLKINESRILMKTITLVAYKRPGYTAMVLDHLNRCRGLEQFDRLAIFIDPGFDGVAEICRSMLAHLPLPAELQINEDKLGVAGNPYRAYSTVFDQLATDCNVAIEDDALLSPDALELALWFFEHHGSTEGRYHFLNLCDHLRYRGPGQNHNGLPEDPALLAETQHLSSPFAWCLSKRAWPFVKKNWNRNQRSIAGWDWSLRFAMRVQGIVALTPVLSRCQNVGRFDGTYDTEETFRVQLGLNYSDGAYRGNYRIVNPLSDAELRRLDWWMVPELSRYFSETR
jgi:hypothetical protein